MRKKINERIWNAAKSMVVLSVFFLSVSINSCVERYWPEITKFENLIVVDGRNYESDIGRLPPPSPIDSVYGVIKSFDIHNVNNPEEAILGYFTVASITEKRIFVNRPLAVPFYYLICEPFFEILEGIVYLAPEFWPIYLTLIPDRGLAGAAQEFCFDCRLEGGTLTPPDFWEE